MVSNAHQTASPTVVISAPGAPRSALSTMRPPTHTTRTTASTPVVTAPPERRPFFERNPPLVKARSARRARSWGITTVIVSRRFFLKKCRFIVDMMNRNSRSIANSTHRK